MVMFFNVKNDKIAEIITNIINELLFSILVFIHLSFGPRAINNKNGIKKGVINLWQNGGPTEIFSVEITSKNIGQTVPIKTTDKKYIINQLFTKIELSLLNQKKLFVPLLFFL